MVTSARLRSSMLGRVASLWQRCAMVVHPQPDLPYDERVLKCIAREVNLNFGNYAQVLVSGTIRSGDGVSMVDWPANEDAT